MLGHPILEPIAWKDESSFVCDRLYSDYHHIKTWLFVHSSVATYAAGEDEILIHQLDDPSLEKFNFYDILKAFCVQADYWLLHHDFFPEGHIIILDIKDCSLRIIPKVNIMFFRDFLLYLLVSNIFEGGLYGSFTRQSSVLQVPVWRQKYLYAMQDTTCGMIVWTLTRPTGQSACDSHGGQFLWSGHWSEIRYFNMDDCMKSVKRLS